MPSATMFVEPGLLIGQGQQLLLRQPIRARRNNDCLTGILITNSRAIHGRYGSVRIKSLKARIQTMSFPTYIKFQVNNSGGGRSNMVVHSNAVILMLLSLFPESFWIFIKAG